MSEGLRTPLSEYGVIYVAYGAKHLPEALHSVKSWHKHHPELSSVLYTSEEDMRNQGDVLRQHFTDIRLHPEIRRSFRDKIPPFKLSPFQRTLFLDGDTEVLGRVDDVFDLLGSYPLACCRDTTRYNLPATSVPAAFSEPNTGVIAYTSRPEAHTLFDLWLRRYDEGLARHVQVHGSHQGYHDQPAFREALYETAYPFYVLPEEYNLRAYAYWMAGARVRILHAREPSLSRWRNAINRHEDMRFGDGEPPLSRLVIETKRWIKERILGRTPRWKDKELLNKSYPAPGDTQHHPSTNS